MSEIKERCPHCPGELIVRSYGAPCRIFYYISCLNSDCRYLLKEFDTEQAAIEFANTRCRPEEADSYDEEVDEFNAGFEAYKAGKSVDDEPNNTKHDVWRIGWVWSWYSDKGKNHINRPGVTGWVVEHVYNRHKAYPDDQGSIVVRRKPSYFKPEKTVLKVRIVED